MSAQKSIKINNSYESEPSSGSSLIDHLEYNTEYDENMHLPYIVKPPSYETEVIIPADGNFYMSSQENNMSNSLPIIYESQLQNKANTLIASPPLSQQPVFRGFTESPYGKLQREFFPTSTSLTAHSITSLSNVASNVSTEKKHSNTKGSTVFARFYDMVVDENSCNAVDIQLSNEEHASTECGENDPHENGVEYLASLCKESETRMPKMISKPFRLSIELSFNGKIKSLTPPSEDDQHFNAGNQIPNESQSFILKKYSNEKSPDLFGDDEDDDGDNDDNLKVEDYVHGKHFNAEELIEEVDDIALIQNIKEAEVQGIVDLKIPGEANEVCGNNAEDYEDASINKSLNCVESNFVDEQTYELESQQFGLQYADAYSLFRENCRREKELLRRIRKCLAGIPPPPSVTIPQLDMFSAVIDRKEEILDFTSNFDTEETCSSSNSFVSLFKPTHSIDEAMEMGWRQVLGVRQHGFCFNLCKASENNEYLGLSVVERFIGAETASSYRNSPSSAKKRNTRLKLLTQSPGNRLSHLARRRATFSSVQLANQKTNNSRAPQILLDVKSKKNKNRRKNTPKRMTPGSKKKSRKTPSSSARKRLFRCDLIKPGPSREASKRALFQSPPKQLDQRPPIQKILPTIKPEIANRIEKSKRALFSPDKQIDSTNQIDSFNRKFNSQSHSLQQSKRFGTYQFDSVLKRKRSAIDDDDTGDSTDLPSQSSKLFRGGAENLTPRALKIKSQSFCIGASSSLKATNVAPLTTTSAMANPVTDVTNFDLMTHKSLGLSTSSNALSGVNPSLSSSTAVGKIQRAHSDMVPQSNTLTENQRKKLLWAVSQALQEKKITTKHESFKQYAAVLARVVRRIFQEFFQKSSTSNSETLLRLSKRYVHYVIAGRNADEIYLQAKTIITRERNESSCRLSGYIGPEDYQRLKNSQQQQQLQEDQINLFSQNSFRSGSLANIFVADPSLDSYQITQSHESTLSSNAIPSTFQSDCHSQSHLFDSTSSIHSSSMKKLSIQPNGSLQNSSSKNNMCGLALRENVNFESDQRRSAQKNFTGKDQRNVSPYANKSSSVGITQMQSKNVISDSSLHHLSTTKVKRQITFDN